MLIMILEALGVGLGAFTLGRTKLIPKVKFSISLLWERPKRRKRSNAQAPTSNETREEIKLIHVDNAEDLTNYIEEDYYGNGWE